MGIFDGILLCSDFDGTMAHFAKVSQENSEAIRYFQSEGGIFCPCSGRETAFFRGFTDVFRANGPIITLNGSKITLYGETPAEDQNLYVGSFPASLALEYADRMLHEESVSRVWFHHVDSRVCLSNEGDAAPEWVRPDVVSPASVTENVCKIVTNHSNTRLPEIRALTEPIYADRFVFGSSWEYGYEAQYIGTDKGSSALRVKEIVGAHTLVSVGDYENDYLLLKAADISYAVGNAVDCLKEIADRVTVPCAEHAIARIVEDLRVEFS